MQRAIATLSQVSAYPEVRKRVKDIYVAEIAEMRYRSSLLWTGLAWSFRYALRM